MHDKIMVPVDLAHKERLGKALDRAASLAKASDAQLVLVGATTPTPSAVAHSPEEFREKLDAFAQETADSHGITAQGHAIIDPDPSIDLGDKLIKTATEISADLIVMATHDPGLREHIIASNGGYVASHAHTSVYLVR